MSNEWELHAKVISGKKLEAQDLGILSVTEILSSEESSQMSITLIELNGTNNMVRNRVCDANYYILEGLGKFDLEMGGEMQEFIVTKGDLITIPKGVLFQDSGNMKMLAIYSPPFDGNQVEIIK